MTSRPPGLVTRNISASAASGSATLRRPNEIVTASKARSPNGSRSASPATKRTGPRPAAPGADPAASGRAGLAEAARASGAPSLCTPAWSMPSEKSQATQDAPSAVKLTDEVPVPAARSRTRSPARAPTAFATTLRHHRSWPSDSTSLSRS